MRAAKRSIGLFLLGIFLAVLFAVGAFLWQSIGLNTPSSQQYERTKLAESEDILPPEILDLLSNSQSTEERVVQISRALHAGTIDSLQLFWPHVLDQFPQRDILWPQVQYHALHALILKFERADWEEWSSLSRKADIAASPARTFVDDLSVINPQLGRYLETAAYLFHQLYRTTLLGQTFDEGKAFQELALNVETVLSRRRVSALPAKLQLYGEILDDVQFRKVFEHIRAKLVASYVNQKTADIENQLQLVLSLDPAHMSPAGFVAIEHVIYRLILQRSSEQRDHIFGDSDKLENLRVFATDRVVRQALSRLYVTRALDMLELGRKSEAEQLYAESTSLGAYVSMHYLIGDFIKTGGAIDETAQIAAGKAMPEMIAPQRSNQGGMLFGVNQETTATANLDLQHDADESGSFSPLFILLIAVLGLMTALVIFFIIRRVLTNSVVVDFETVDPIEKWDPVPEPQRPSSKVKGFPSPAELKKKRVNS